MKVYASTIQAVFLSLFFLFAVVSASAQCEPMGPEECPDPEDNGQICPEVMPYAYLDQVYTEEATILAPEQDTTGILLHHITLQEVENLPPGISWESNAPNNEFMAGNYYCIVLEGTPTIASTFNLKIVVDIYIDFLGQPVYVTQVVDSTSLSIVVREDFGLAEQYDDITLIENYPNPFTEQTNIEFKAGGSSTGYLDIYSLQGAKVYTEDLEIKQGNNSVIIKGNLLPAGTYCYAIRTKRTVISGLMVKAD